MEDNFARNIGLFSLILSAGKIIYDILRDTQRINIVIERVSSEEHSDVLSVTFINKSSNPILIIGAGLEVGQDLLLGVGEITTNDKNARNITFGTEASGTKLPAPAYLGSPIRLLFDYYVIRELRSADRLLGSVVFWESEGKKYKMNIPRYIHKNIEQEFQESNAAQPGAAPDASTGGEKHAVGFRSLAAQAQRSRIVKAILRLLARRG